MPNFTVSDRFKVTFYLDTNILSYLVDKSFSGVIKCFEFLKDCPFVILKSSHFVIFEFVGIRKREHFLREIVKQSKNLADGTPNLSSLLKYNDSYKIQNIDYKDCKDIISDTILNTELDIIVNQYNIQYEEVDFPAGIWRLTFDLHLASRITKEDSLVTISCAFFSDVVRDKNISHIITNDTEYYRSYHEDTFSTEIKGVFTNHGVQKPEMIKIDAISATETERATVNLTNSQDDPRIIEVVRQKIVETVIKMNADFYLGKTISVPQNAPENAICLNLKAGQTIEENRHLVIIDKELTFFYSTKTSVSDFRDQMQVLTYPYTRDEDKNLCFLLLDELPLDLENNITIEILRQSGNYIFFHPDE